MGTILLGESGANAVIVVLLIEEGRLQGSSVGNDHVQILRQVWVVVIATTSVLAKKVDHAMSLFAPGQSSSALVLIQTTNVVGMDIASEALRTVQF